VKFLVDANLADRVARLLENAGHEAVHVRALGMGRDTDAEIFEKAVELGAIVVSEDTDFGALLAQRGTGLPSLVLLRTADPLTPEQQASLIVSELPLVRDDLAQGAILVLGRGRARLRPLPIASPDE
jgi:predicted nuclease of predicted toxin-antitoxin system